MLNLIDPTPAVDLTPDLEAALDALRKLVAREVASARSDRIDFGDAERD